MSNDLNLYFRFRCEKGLKDKGLSDKPEYIRRLKYEIDVITQLNYAGYFLVVADMLHWARSHRIPVGPGRGSGAGSLCVFALKISYLDPIKYGLIFERFLNPARVTQPDIDLDFCKDKRDQVIAYLQQKYTDITHIGTYGSMKVKGAIRDIARTLGYDYEVGDKLSKLVLPPISGKEQSLETCYEQVPELTAFRNQKEKGAPEAEVLSRAERLEGSLRVWGIHASGYIVSDTLVSNYSPLFRGKDGLPVSQYEMNNIEEVGLIKFDLLGLQALTTIDRCLSMIRENYDIEIDDFPLDEPQVYKSFQEGDTTGIFQAEGSEGFRGLLVQIKPTCLEDISLVTALFRPGPLESGMVEQVVNVRQGKQKPQYLVPELEPILKETNGCIVYQEQMMQMARDLAGYSLAEADILRKATGKKIASLMEEQREKFIQGMVSNGYQKGIATELFQQIQGFARYSFNLSHSISYSYISYQMAYLKTFYPLEFMCSCLISESEDREKIIRYINYCRERGIKVLPPDINKSEEDFSLDGEGIRFGLRAIKHIGASAKQIIRERRKRGAFVDLIDFGNRLESSVDRGKVTSLIEAGAFDSLCDSRKSLKDDIGKVWSYRDEQKKYESKMETYGKKLKAYKSRLLEIKNGAKKKPFKKPVLPLPPEKVFASESLEDMSRSYKLKKERELLGFFLSGHPLDSYQIETTIAGLKENCYHRQRAILTAIPAALTETTTKKGKKKMGFITLEDKTGTMEVVSFSNTYLQYKDFFLDNTQPARYSIQVEVVQNDESQIVKGRLIGVTEAKPLKHMKVSIPLKKAVYLAEKISQNKGKDILIGLSIEGGDHIWEIGTFPCRKSIQEVL
jgi:DNA polymerase-3 subunit alpha